MTTTPNTTMKTLKLTPLALTVTAIAIASPLHTQAQTNAWTFDVSLYGLAAAMSGDVTVKGVTSDLDVGFDQIWDNLELGGMAKVRVGHGQWAFTTDVIYMGLSASKNNVSAELDQWVVEPTLSYQLCSGFEVLAGARYNNISGDVRGPLGINPSGTQDWWDPIFGASAALPVSEKISFHVRGDVGGFDVGSTLTWQAFPYLNWQLSHAASIQIGYRWVYTDYETGSGLNRFRYDVLTQGPQAGFTWSF